MSFKLALPALVLSLAFAATAQAGTVDLGALPVTGSSFSAITDTNYTFTLNPGLKLTNIDLVTSTNVSSASFSLEELVGGSWVSVGGTAMESIPNNTTVPLFLSENYTGAGAGFYELIVSETLTAGTGQGSFGGNISISTVPVPGALLLMGSALGLGGLASRLRGRKARAQSV